MSNSNQLPTWTSLSEYQYLPKSPALVQLLLLITGVFGGSRLVRLVIPTFFIAHSFCPKVLNHAPISGVGARQIRHFELPFIRYDVPICSPITPASPPLLNLQTNKPRAPRIRYSIDSPQIPIGPLDLVSISIHLLPLDHGVSVRSASVIVERRIQLHDQPSGSTSIPQISSSSYSPRQSPTLLPSFPRSPSAPFQEDHLLNAESSMLSLSSYSPTSTPSIASESAPLLHSNSIASTGTKLVVNPIVGTESSGTLFRDENGVWNRTLTLQWPTVRSPNLWAIGETISSNLVTVKYFIRTKVRFFFLVVRLPRLTLRLDHRLLSVRYRVNRPCRSRTPDRIHQ